MIQCDECDVGDKDFVVATLQTLRSRSYPREFLQQFGTTIIDEAHHIAARAFSEVMKTVPSRYVLGLSATPERKDGLTRLLHWLVGPVAFRASREHAPNVNVMKCVYTQGKESEIVYKNGTLGVARMVNGLTKDRRRTNFIAHMVSMVLTKNPNRKLLILSDRRDHVDEVQKAVDGLQRGVDVDAKWKTGVIVGGMKPGDIAVQKDAQVILSTYHYCSEGFDLPRLDTLLLSTPRTSIEQSVGRILRAHPDKENPVVLDFVDNFSIFAAQSLKRTSFYEKQGYTIKTYDDTELLSK
jgi:superfamily II DNA or RNA helicase